MPLSLKPRPRQKAMPIAKTLPLDVGIIHFVGIGGIGMSGIAEILHNLGYKVQGSDLSQNPNTERLQNMGIEVFIGHAAEHIAPSAGGNQEITPPAYGGGRGGESPPAESIDRLGSASVPPPTPPRKRGGDSLGVQVVVVSTAVKPDNPEVMAAREERIPVVRRAEMLAELMRMKLAVAIAGTHGKTTTTALVAAMLETGGLEPTVINGGILNARSTNAYLGQGDWMVVEADESDGTFNRVPATVGVVTNIDPEHLDHYGSFDALKEAFHTFVTNLPFYGAAIMCIDHPEVQTLVGKITDRRVITYGFSPQADIRAQDVVPEAKGQRFNVIITDKTDHTTRMLEGVFLAMHGQHNLTNAMAAIAVAVELGISDESILKALSEFKGVKRRFTYTGEVNGVSIIDDYAHHPVEITATLSAARHVQDSLGGKVVAVIQPHRYTRLRDLFDEFCGCFNDADTVVVTDVYTAGEDPIEGASQHDLVEGLKRAGHKHVLSLEGEDMLPALIKQESNAGDMVVCMGAGSISKWANELPAKLESLSG